MQKVALVTGAGTGIGRAVAVQLAKKGLAVAVNFSRSEKEAQETVELVRQQGVPGLLCRANVASEQEVRSMVGRCTAELGRLDVLVNNAGTTHFIDHTNLDALTDEVWDEIFGVNLKGSFYCCRAALPAVQEQSGVIINVTSVAGLQGAGSSIPYCASKAALNCMTKSLARAFAPKVRVNAVAPGPVKTRWLVGHEERIERSLPLTPMRRMADPDDIADAVTFLAVDNTFITGQILVVDGGRTM